MRRVAVQERPSEERKSSTRACPRKPPSKRASSLVPPKRAAHLHGLSSKKRTLPSKKKREPSKKAARVHEQASKEQMQASICREFNLPGPPEPNDVADALAIALCHAYLGKEY